MKIAILGCGKQGAKHLRAFRRLPGIDSIAPADLDPTRARALAEQLQAPSYETVDAAFDDPESEAIVICTPTPSHDALLRRAMATGKHVLCEKPLVEAVADQANGPIARIAYLYRFAPAIAEARRLVVSGELGDIRSARFRIAAPGSQSLWKHRRADGGGALNELAAHMIDLALWFFGAVEHVELRSAERRLRRRIIGGTGHDVDADDYAKLRLIFREAVVTVEADFAAPRFEQWIAIEGARGMAHASIDPAFASSCVIDGVHRPIPSGDTDLYVAQAQAFLAAIAAPDASNSICTLREASATARILAALA